MCKCMFVIALFVRTKKVNIHQQETSFLKYGTATIIENTVVRQNEVGVYSTTWTYMYVWEEGEREGSKQNQWNNVLDHTSYC